MSSTNVNDVVTEARQMRTPSQDFLQQLDTINRNLGLCDQQLSTLLHKPVPNSREALTQATDNYDVRSSLEVRYTCTFPSTLQNVPAKDNCNE